jgi:phosphoadenosine phosphosulfate reductase
VKNAKNEDGRTFINKDILIKSFLKNLEGKSPFDIIKYFVSDVPKRILLTSSLGAEDQVLTDICYKVDPEIKIIFLDTGKTHQETYDVMKEVIKKYGIMYKICYPKEESVNALEKLGSSFIYKSVENRKQCCYVRKVEPLKRVLSSCDVWITGLRKSQSITRAGIRVVEWDSSNGIIKLNPLANWSNKDVWNYIRKEKVPYNKLHDKGYASIGCIPCTRAIKEKDDIRSGRWWWESPEHKECGLHVSK